MDSRPIDDHVQSTEDGPTTDLRNSIKLTLSIYEPTVDTELVGRPEPPEDESGSGKSERSSSAPLQAPRGRRVIYRLYQLIGGRAPEDSGAPDEEVRAKEAVTNDDLLQDHQRAVSGLSVGSPRPSDDDGRRTFDIKDLIDSIKTLRSCTNQRLSNLISQEKFKEFEALKEKLVHQQLLTASKTHRSLHQDDNLDQEEEVEEEEEEEDGQQAQV